MAKKITSTKVIVTGGAGFIGSHLVDQLIVHGYLVTVLDDLSGGTQTNLHPQANFVKVDIRDWETVDQIFNKTKPHLVYHLAANAAESKAQFSPIDITSRNYDGSMKVLTAALRHGVKRFIFTSSIAVYGQLQTPFTELAQPMPEDTYGITKLAFEDSLRILGNVHGLEYVIVRPHNVYGPRQNMRDPYRNVVTIFMNSLLKNEPFYIYGDGTQERCFSYIDDVVSALFKCASLTNSGLVINIGSDTSSTINHLAELIMSISHRHTKIVYLPARPQEVKTAISDHTLARKYLQYRDRTSLPTGLKKTWRWVHSLGPQKPVYTTMEIPSQKLPKNWRRRQTV